jgi:hypothetical protein
MSNNIVFYTTTGWEIHLFPIQIEIGTKAFIKCIQMSSLGMYLKEYTIQGDEYTNWGSDDDYIKNYICDKEGYLGRPCDVTEKPNIPISQDDNRSVHNEADIQRIQTLQEQLDAQALKLKTITDMLIGKGFV